MNFSKDLIGKKVKWLKKIIRHYHGNHDFNRGIIADIIPKGKSAFAITRKHGFSPKNKAADIARINDRVFVISGTTFYTPVIGAIVEDRG